MRVRRYHCVLIALSIILLTILLQSLSLPFSVFIPMSVLCAGGVGLTAFMWKKRKDQLVFFLSTLVSSVFLLTGLLLALVLDVGTTFDGMLILIGVIGWVMTSILSLGYLLNETL